MGCVNSTRLHYDVRVVPSKSPVEVTRSGQNDDGVAASVMAKSATTFGKVSLVALLRDTTAAAHFRKFLEKDFADNSLDFYEDVMKLLDAPDEDREVSVQLSVQAAKIQEQYLRPGAEREVNLPCNIRAAACSRDPDAMSRRATLSRCRDEILRLMAFDALPRFVQSSLYREMLAGKIEADSLCADEVPPVLGTSMRYDHAAHASFRGFPRSSQDRTWLERFSSMADLLPVCISVADYTLPDTPLVYVNAEFIRTTGYAWEDICDRNCRFLQGPLTSAEAIQLLRDSLKSHTDVRVELLNYRKDGTPFINLLAMRYVSEYATEEDARERRGGVCRYVLGVQHEVTSESMHDTRVLQLDALVKLLPSFIVNAIAAPSAGGTGVVVGAASSSSSPPHTRHVHSPSRTSTRARTRTLSLTGAAGLVPDSD